MAYSALLDRLLAGDDPLPFPPPTLYRQPAYWLCDGEPHVVHEVIAHPDPASIVDIGGQRWDIIERLEDSRYLLSYRMDSPLFILDTGDNMPTLTMHDPKFWFRV